MDISKFSKWISLFTSSGTLLCCALPSLLVTLGMGTAVVGLVTAVPQLIWLSQHKVWVFLFSGIMIGISWYLEKRSQTISCPMDQELAEACKSGKRWSELILKLSIAIWVTGAFFAFIGPLLMA